MSGAWERTATDGTRHFTDIVEYDSAIMFLSAHFWAQKSSNMSLNKSLITHLIIIVVYYIWWRKLDILCINPLKPNEHYSGRTAPLTSKRCILYIYSTNMGTEYFRHGIYSPFFPSSKCSLFHNSNIFGSCIIHILYTGCAKIKKKNSGAKRLM